MKSSFVAYVDESGDEGFVFHPDGTGSSRWFVLTAAVIRQTNDLQMVSCLKEVRDILKKVYIGTKMWLWDTVSRCGPRTFP